MKSVEKTNTVIMCSNQRAEFVQYNLYTIEVDQENRNYYNCRGFGHLTRNCRNRGMGNRIGKDRRLKYRNYEQNNLNENKDLIILDQISVVAISLQCLQEQQIIYFTIT